MTRKDLTKEDFVIIGQAIATGASVLETAGNIGTDRSAYSAWLRDPAFLEEVASGVGSPRNLGAEALAGLFEDDNLPHERDTSAEIRHDFAAAIQAKYPKFAEERRAAEAREREREKRRRDEAEEKYRKMSEAERARVLRNAACAAADFFNLSTLCIVQAREWKNGTRDELARGLDTPAKRRAWRCAHGITWGCAGFGVYYSPKWSARRCIMRYMETEDRVPFDRINADPTLRTAWAEIEAESSLAVADAYDRDPYKRRDPGLPTDAAKAEELLKAIEGGAPFGGKA